MTSSSDDWGEMTTEQPLLNDFLDELRSWGAGPVPEPTAALASLLDRGRIEPTAGQPQVAPAPPTTRRKNVLTKLAGLGVLAKAGLGLGVATAAVTTAGVTGVLPPPAQHAVATVIDAVSPLQLPDPTAKTGLDVGANLSVPGSTTDVRVPDVDDPADHDATDDATEDATHDRTDAGRADNHGACVSAVAHDDANKGRDHGKAVSAAARSDCGKDDATTTSSSTTSPSTTTTSLAGNTTAATEDHGNRGQGQGQSEDHENGNGNSNRGGGSANSRSGKN
jgi:hypothetical protein